MTLISRGLLAVLMACAVIVGPAAAQDGEVPLLVTYGQDASTIEGDHDHRQVIHFSVPATTSGPLYVRVFDPDAFGRHDQLKSWFNTRTRFSLYSGAGAGPRRDAKGVLQEDADGEPLASREFGQSPGADDSWQLIAKTSAARGALAGDRREFHVLVEGLSGDDGNAYSLAVSTVAEENRAPEGLRVYGYLPTVRVPDRVNLIELAFTIPEHAKSLTVHNFDAAKAQVFFAGQFRSATLQASDQKMWQATTIEVAEDERGKPASITLFDGAEQLNDITLAIEDDRGAPVALLLPPRLFTPNERPLAEAAVAPLACHEFQFDATGTRAPEGEPLGYVWRFHDGSSIDGVKARKTYAGSGDFKVRLEAFDASGRIGNGDKVEFTLPVKIKPAARIDLPAKVSQGAPVTLDGSASTPDPKYPDSQFIWRLPDETELSGAKPRHAFAEHGAMVIRLTVRDAGAVPCNEDSAEASLYVDALPIAVAGGDRTAVVGEALRFDGARSADPDGRITAHAWDFGDGGVGHAVALPHAYHDEGEFDVTLTVTDDSGFARHAVRDKARVTVRPRPNTPPFAKADGKRVAMVGEVVRFSAGASRDDDGSLLAHDWDFGDGAKASGVEAPHSYWRPGEYKVRLGVRDASARPNAMASDDYVLKVTPPANQAPIADAGADREGLTGMAVAFDGSASRDPDGNIVSHDWDFGDGAKYRGARVAHAYAKPGQYAATLTVTDDSGPYARKASATVNVIVKDAANRPPIANAGKDMTAAAGETVRFDASASRDPDGAILSYAWDFGDGFASTGVAPRHIYQKEGRYQVTLRVKDNGDNPPGGGEDKLTVTVTAVPNKAPVANAGGDIEATAGDIIRFDASASSDPDGNITAYEWDFGTGEKSASISPLYAYQRPGLYRARLTVWDDHKLAKLSSSTSVTVRVKASEDGKQGETSQ